MPEQQQSRAMRALKSKQAKYTGVIIALLSILGALFPNWSSQIKKAEPVVIAAVECVFSFVGDDAAENEGEAGITIDAEAEVIELDDAVEDEGKADATDVDTTDADAELLEDLCL